MKTLLLLTALLVSNLTFAANPVDSCLVMPNASFPRLITDERGNPVLTWIERSESSLSLVHRISTDGGQTFGEPTRISLPATTSAHGEDVPKLIFKGDGTRMVVFSLPKPTSDALRAGNLLYKRSSDQGKTWSQEQPIHRDTTAGKSHSYAELTRLPNGEVGLIWLDEKLANREGRTVRFTQTVASGGFGPEIVVDSNACQCCRPGIVVDKEGRIYLTYRDWLSAETGLGARDISYTVSTDGGQSFSQPTVLVNDNWQINACPHSGPQLFVQDEAVYATWYSGTSNHAGIRLARLDKSQTPELIAGSNRTHPQLTGWPDGRLAMVWEELVGEAPDAYRQTMVRIYAANGEFRTKALTATGELTSLPVLLPTSTGLLVAYQVWQGQSTSVLVKRVPFFQP
ncbi:sialidase family protein [Spirosoma arboris]|nr:sialidase family protein [Spirosoma arboris]